MTDSDQFGERSVMSKSNVTPVMDANVRSKLCEYLRLRRRSEALALPAWLEMDHNLNASLNLKMLAGSSPVSACCPGSSGRVRKSATKLLVGQEPSREDEVYD
jgi:hypothetical protein